MKMPGSAYHVPPDKQGAVDRAKRLEWMTILFMLTIIAAIGLTMGASQAMKAVWIEDVLSLIPPIAFLIGTYYRGKPPDERFPYGYRRAVLIAFLCAALALFSFGLYILIDSTVKLVTAEHPTIQTIEIFGRRVWLGWLMIAALVDRHRRRARYPRHRLRLLVGRLSGRAHHLLRDRQRRSR